MNARHALLLARTVRHLKPKQIAYQIRYRIQNSLPVLSRISQPHEQVLWQPLIPLTPFLNRSWLRAADIEKSGFNFLNCSEAFSDTICWATLNQNRLWRYNLHYFDYLFPDRPLENETAERLMMGWVSENSPGTADAWDPFPLSLRVVNWIKYLSKATPQVSTVETLVLSLLCQVKRLERRLEFHLLANHLFKNIKALVFAGLFFQGPQARRWLKRGLKLIEEELPEQVGQDGGHFERSPMYHSMILEDCLDLYNVCSAQPQGDLQSLSRRLLPVITGMITFLNGMTHPDGQIALFNDAAFGIEAPPRMLTHYFEQVTGKSAPGTKEKFWSFPETGYFVMAPEDGDRMIIDCGPIGPDYQPGHGHCDTLSFELSLKGRRVIVDSGCFQYEDGPIRQYNRGNAGHNTVTIDGENQSEVWGAHRCARRARPVYAKLEQMPDGGLFFEGAHDGYRRLSGSPIHHRTVMWAGDQCRVEDHVKGSGRHDIESRLHMHPDLDLEFDPEQVVVHDQGRTLLSISTNGTEKLERASGWYCPEFGKQLPCTVLIQNFKNVSLPFKFGWVLHTH